MIIQNGHPCIALGKLLWPTANSRVKERTLYNNNIQSPLFTCRTVHGKFALVIGHWRRNRVYSINVP